MILTPARLSLSRLISPAGETGDRCRIVHRAKRAGLFFALCMLTDMSVIEVTYPRQEAGWNQNGGGSWKPSKATATACFPP